MIIWIQEFREDPCNCNWWFNGPVDTTLHDSPSTPEEHVTSTILGIIALSGSDSYDYDDIKKLCDTFGVAPKNYQFFNHVEECELPVLVEKFAIVSGDWV